MKSIYIPSLLVSVKGLQRLRLLIFCLMMIVLSFQEKTFLTTKSYENAKGNLLKKTYLRKEFASKISVVRILDSDHEHFKISKAYEHKVCVHDIVTKPEIEILIIHHLRKFDHFSKNKNKYKPSEYCKQILGLKRVKDYDFVKDFFKDPNELIKAIEAYNRSSNLKKGAKTLLDLLKCAS